MKPFCCLAPLISALTCATGHAATFTVTNILAIGPSSLSNAIAQANATAAADSIEFNIPGPGVKTITLSNSLPDITRPVTIDGYTQPGSSSNTLASGHNAVILIELSGENNINGLIFKDGATNSTVRGLVLNHFSTAIDINPAATVTLGNVVEGCFIGVDPTGMVARGNTAHGVRIFRGGNNRIGGVVPGARNIIAASFNGIAIDVSANNNVVQGNFIGTDKTGTNTLPNTSNGIFINNGANNCLIGGTTTAARNIIAGNGQGFGIQCANSSGNLIQGNFIGTDAFGTTRLSPGHGVLLLAASALIGGLTPTPGTPPGNVIAGFSFGVTLSDNSVVQGNLIGTDATGTRDFGSTSDGLTIGFAKNCTVGGTNGGEGNVISGHNQKGIAFTGGASNRIQGNFIGTDITGANPLPNGAAGIDLTSGHDNVIGPANIIVFNGDDGISSSSSSETNNQITANSIFANGSASQHLGIDLGTSGVTANDVGDGDTGPNRLQNFPAITGVAVGGGNATLSGTFNSSTNASFRLEFFSNASCDPSGNGEGQVFLGFTNVTTDAGGNAAFTLTLANPVSHATFTSTATDTNGNTSEFSPCASQSGPCSIICPGNMVVSTTPGECGAGVSFFANTSGNCGGVNCSPASGSFFARGITTVTCNTVAGTNCSFIVTVNDTVAPAITCPANIVTNVPPDQTSAVVSYSRPVVAENCPGATTNCAPPSGSVFPLGSTTVNCTAIDSSGNSRSCSFTVTVATTNAPPIAQCRNVTTNANANCQAVVAAAAVDDGSLDPDGTIVSRTLNPPGPYAKGTNAVTLTVVDDRGGSNSCTASIIVVDTTPPLVNCPANIVTNASDGQANLVVNFGAATVTDNCPGGAATATCTPPSGSAFTLGTTMVTCRTNDASGNTNSCSFTVTVNPTAATITWDGGGANSFWTTAANWAGDTLPFNGDGLVFPTNAARRVNTNTVNGPTNLAFIELSGSNYVIHSPPLTLSGGLTNIPPFLGSNALHVAITLGRDQTWRLGPLGQKTELILKSNLNLSRFRLTVNADSGLLEAAGNVTGSAGSQLLKTGSGPLHLNGSANDIPDLRVLDGGLVVDGVLSGGLLISGGGRLQGTGTVPPFTCSGGGDVTPGRSILTVSPGEATFLNGSRLNLNLFGSAIPGSDYGQLRVATPPNLSGASLNFVLAYLPSVGERFVIISNTGAALFTTAFAGLPEGAVFEHVSNPPLRTNEFQITYAGGDGNDVVLTLTGYNATGTTRIWSGEGTNNLWTHPFNWIGSVAPNQGDNLLFPPGASRLHNTNDFPAGTVFNSITIGASGYVLRGATVRINDGIHGTFANGSSEVRWPIVLTRPQTFTNNGGGTLNFLGASMNNAGHDLAVRAGVGPVVFGEDSIMSGTGGLIKEGAGVLRLAGTASNVYGGATIVNAGTLELTKALPNIAVPHDLIIGDGVGGPGADVVRLISQDQIADSSAVLIASSGLLDTAGRVDTIGALSGSGALIIGNSFACDFSGVSTFSGTISGSSGALLKRGSGTLIFSGTNLHTGVVQCSAGTLQVDGVQLAPLTRLTSGGILRGSGTLGALDLNGTGSTIAPGASPGTLTCSNYNADALGNATFEVELNGLAAGSGYDQLNVRGTVDIAGDTLSVSLNFASGLSNQFVIINNDGNDAVVGTFVGRPEGSTFAVGSEQFRISYVGGDGNDVVLTQTSSITAAAPRLEIEALSANAVRLLWPTNPPGFNLENNTNLADTNGWSGASPPPVVTGTNNVVTTATTEPQRFYRLKKD